MTLSITEKLVYTLGECVSFFFVSSGYGETATEIRKLVYQIFDADTDEPLSEASGVIPIDGQQFLVDASFALTSYLYTPFPQHSEGTTVYKDTSFEAVPEMCRNVKIKFYDQVFDKVGCSNSIEDEKESQTVRVSNSSENWDHIIGISSFENLLTEKPYLNNATTPIGGNFFLKVSKVSLQSEDYIYVLGGTGAIITAYDIEGNVIDLINVANSNLCVSYMGCGVRNIWGLAPPANLKYYSILFSGVGATVKQVNFSIIHCCDPIAFYFHASNSGGYELVEFDRVSERSIRSTYEIVCSYSDCKSFGPRSYWQEGGPRIENKKSQDKLKLEKIIDINNSSEYMYYKSILASGNYYVLLENKNNFLRRLRYIPTAGNIVYDKVDESHKLVLDGYVSRNYDTGNYRI